jgi:hypothetical protein
VYGYRAETRSVEVRCREEEDGQPQSRHCLASAIMRKAEIQRDLGGDVKVCELVQRASSIL